MDTVTSARQPRSALDWLRKGVSLLADLAADRLVAADYRSHRLPGAATARRGLASARQWPASWR